ncbi:MAG: hypothetical protein V7K15_20300 [Nostoc sp.]
MQQGFQTIKNASYTHDSLQLSELPSNVSESRVIVTFIEPKKSQAQKQIMRFGMFSGNKQSTKKDFPISEFNEDTEDFYFDKPSFV